MALKIFNPAQIKKIEQESIRLQGISTDQLMERAGQVFTDWMVKKWNSAEVHIFCGRGNNGGDGLVIGRLLSQRFWKVNIWLLPWESESSPDFQLNFQRLNLKQGIVLKNEFSNSEILTIQPDALIIDAILGTGTNRTVHGHLKETIQTINRLPNLKISVDIPSGLLPCDNSLGVAIKSDWTLTFEYPKLAFLMPENEPYVKNWDVASIQLSKQAEINETINFYVTEKKDVQKMCQPRSRFAHKYQCGQAAILAGAPQMCGAGILSADACLRSGAGLVTLISSEQCKSALFSRKPEIIFAISSELDSINWEKVHALCIGPGLNQKILQDFFANGPPHVPLVVDAEAIRFLAKNPEILGQLPKNSVFTPHTGELSDLLGDRVNSFHLLNKAMDWCTSHGHYMVLKGAYSACISPDKETWFNHTGNPGLATAGSGDVLSGIITGLLAQSYPVFDAMRLGVWLHGLSADLALENESEESLNAGDLIKYLGRAYKDLMSA
ncbi:MAG: NAD(P)H-hydrate dehydratase [Saprospiraceae bacterium]|nr:NAD(P)H-hydrate dehydratase [Saprospiraceae bacterium]